MIPEMESVIGAFRSIENDPDYKIKCEILKPVWSAGWDKEK